MRRIVSVLGIICFLQLILNIDLKAQNNITGLINSPALPWDVSDWYNSKALTLEDVKGKVVLVRWWTGPHCPFCLNSAAALNEFYELYRKRGLEVIGFYHHKSFEPINKIKVRKLADELGFKFPVAVDYNWSTLKKWWMNAEDRQWTSVTFLLDKNGMIRHIHPGGQYVKGNQDYKALKAMIEKLLEESS